jgi:hypothetical protein
MAIALLSSCMENWEMPSLKTLGMLLVTPKFQSCKTDIKCKLMPSLIEPENWLRGKWQLGFVVTLSNSTFALLPIDDQAQLHIEQKYLKDSKGLYIHPDGTSVHMIRQGQILIGVVVITLIGFLFIRRFRS